MKKNKLLLPILLALIVLAGIALRLALPGSGSQSSAETSPALALLPDAQSAQTKEPAQTQKPEEQTQPAQTQKPEEQTQPAQTQKPEEQPSLPSETRLPTLDENGSYTTREDVALYIRLYGKLPQNYITKKEAESLGWSGGSLEPYAPGKSIGGSYFGNYEGLLPEAPGRKYTECDIDTQGKSSRGAKRIVFSNDGLIFYTDDHYESFTLLYGEVD